MSPKAIQIMRSEAHSVTEKMKMKAMMMMKTMKMKTKKKEGRKVVEDWRQKGQIRERWS